MAVTSILFYRERLILQNTLTFPYHEELEGSQQGRKLAEMRLFLPLVLLLDNIRAELFVAAQGRLGEGIILVFHLTQFLNIIQVVF